MFEELDTDEKEPQAADENSGDGSAAGKLLVIFLAILTPVYFFVRHMWGPDRALTAFLCLAMSMVAVGICWELRERIWFWAVIFSLLALHIPLVAFVQWPRQWVPGIAFTPLGVADVAITIGIVRFVQKSIMKDKPRNEES